MEINLNYALVTGASSGIGWHISELLAQKGYPVIAVSNQPLQLEDLKSSLEQKYGIRVITINCDLARENSALEVFETCKKQNLNVEVLVNDAGTLIFGEALGVDFPRTRSILNLHVTTPALLCRLFAEQMINRGKGYILNVASISSVMPYPTISLYGPTKAFLRFYTRALRTELKQYCIKVTCLLPGATLTSLYDPGRFNTSLKRKLGILQKPEVVAKAGIRALFRDRPESIPGCINKLIVYLVPLVPSFIIAFIYKKVKSRLLKIPGNAI